MSANPSRVSAVDQPPIPFVRKAHKAGVRGAHYTGDRPTPEKLDQLYNQQKLSSSEIARQYSVTRKTVTNWLEMAGIDRRSGTEAGMLRCETQAEFVPSAEREDCVLDRAWEARPERRIRDKVCCRLCFRQVSRLTGKTAHLAIHHNGMAGDEYARLMPEHRHDCFQHSADANRLDVEKLMEDWRAKWATADEIRDWRRVPKLAQSQEYIGCLECGRKIFGESEIQRHLKLVHKWSLQQYHEKYPEAPTGSLARRAMQAKRGKRIYQDRKIRLVEAEQIPMLTAQIAEAEKKAIDMREQLARRQQALAEQEAAVKCLQLQLAASQPTRVQVRNEYPAVLARMQKIFSHAEEKLFENRWTEFDRALILCARRAVLGRVWKKNRAKAAARMYLAHEFSLTLRTIEEYLEDLT
jgi:hypothetical protein